MPRLLQFRHGMSKVFKQKKTQEQEKPDEVKKLAVAAFKQVRCHVADWVNFVLSASVLILAD